MKRLIALSTGLLTVAAALFTFTASAEASYYYDESYYNKPIPCYQYDGAGHCVRSGNRYVANSYNNNSYYGYGNTYGSYYNGSRYSNSSMYGNGSIHGNSSTYSTQYPYGWTNSSTNGSTYRPVDNYYRSQQNNGCYWYYGSYRCDSRN